MDRHRLAEERSIALHRAVADQLRKDPRLLERARERVRGWRDSGSVAIEYITGWESILGGSLEEIDTALVDPSENARALRQVSPFAGFLEPRERWRILKSVAPVSDP